MLTVNDSHTIHSLDVYKQHVTLYQKFHTFWSFSLKEIEINRIVNPINRTQNDPITCFSSWEKKVHTHTQNTAALDSLDQVLSQEYNIFFYEVNNFSQLPPELHTLLKADKCLWSNDRRLINWFIYYIYLSISQERKKGRGVCGKCQLGSVNLKLY